MERIPCIECNPKLLEYIRPYLESWGYRNYTTPNWYRNPVLIVNECGNLGYCNNYNLNYCSSYNRELVTDVEEFLERAATLKGFTYKRKDIMRIHRIEIKPGMGIYINDRTAENLYIVIPTKTGLGVVSYGQKYTWEHLNKFLEQDSNKIVAICDVPDSSIEGNILWEKPEEIVITMDEIAEKFGYPVEQIKIKK